MDDNSFKNAQVEAAFSAAEVLSKIVKDLDNAAELIEKFIDKYPDCKPLLEMIKSVQGNIMKDHSSVFEKEFSRDNTYDKEPFQIKFYKRVSNGLYALCKEPAWQSSIILKNLNQVFVADLKAFQSAIQDEDPTHVRINTDETEKEDESLFTYVYVSLYCVSGEIHDWEKILQNIGKQVISRPILVNEDDVKSLIRSKPNPHNQAYAALKLLESNVIRKNTADRPDQDVMGHEMVSIKDSRLELDVIEYFVHDNQIYYLEHGLLVAK